ncbi:maestro heat-like repeat-containing protein family member 2B [Podarcis raffonei]|uniref:maestro heat-like repeat-containing protein family member 2B n=1 Tax=Podarcis raffonei TaxID=65483 RepID=UPI002329504B|nr:maestro heat-like repeat-containing protein family member 2B [Podarcis raffonei]
MDVSGDLKTMREIYNYICCSAEQNADLAAQSLIQWAGPPNIDAAIHVLVEMLKEEDASGRIVQQANDVLLSLASSLFNDVMYRLQKNVKTGILPHHMVFRTLGNLASRYALRCIPFLSLTCVYLRVMIKWPMTSHMKEAICYVMEHFCAAINYYYKNWRACSFPRETEAQLCSPVIPIYQRLAGDWLNDEEPKVKEALMKAQWPMLGALVRCRTKQDEIIRKIPQVLRDSKILDSFLIAKRLNIFLDVCEEYKPPIPKKISQAVCDFVFKQVVPRSTSGQQKIMERFKHQRFTVERQIQDGELFPCHLSSSEHQELCMDHRNVLMEAFAHLVGCCPVDALDFLQTQMKEDSEYIRVGFLMHLKMIVGNDGPCESRNKKQPIVEAVKCLLDDHREGVRKALLHFIKELLCSQNVEGCPVWEMVVYIFSQFTVHISHQHGKDPAVEQKEKEERIQELCIDVLENLNTSAEGMSKALWPRLLFFVVPAPYTPTLTPLCRCLKEMALGREDDTTLFLGSCKGVGLPSAHGLVARLLVLASNPNQRGSWALQLLHALHCNIHTAITKLWAKQIPFLWESFLSKAMIQTESTEIRSQEWEKQLLQFLRRTLETIDDNTWTQNLSRELESQMTSYAQQSPERRFLYKSLGIALTCCEDPAFVQSRMKHLIENANYMEQLEREKIIQILSFSAVGHLDLTLATLQEFGAGMGLKIKMSSIISRYKDYQQGRRGHVHQTLMLTYGKVALQAPKELLLPRVEADIMKNVLCYYRKSCQVLGVSIENKDSNLKLAFVESTTDICQAICETQDFQNFTLTCKKELLDILLDFIKEEPLDSLNTALRPQAITALAFLSKLKPCLAMEEIRNLLDQSIKSLFPLPSLEQLKETAGDALKIESLYSCSMDALRKLVTSIVEDHPTPELIVEMFQLIDPWFTVSDCSRERALQASSQTLAAFQENYQLPDGENFQQFGSLVAFLAPYTCDGSVRCRQWAAQCISCLLHIQAQSKVTAEEEEEMLSACRDLKAEVPSSLFEASCRMAKVVSVHFPPDQALDFIEVILEDLVSGNEMCATAAGRWLLTILWDSGDAMGAQVSEILDIFYSRLPTIKQEDLRQVLVEAVAAVSHFHLDTVIESLFCRRLPMDSETGELWRSLGKDPSQALLILCKLAARVAEPSSLEAPFSSGSNDSVEFADEGPLKATCAIYEVLSVLHTEEGIQELFPELFCTLLKQVSKTLEKRMPFYEGRRRLFLREQHLSEGNPCRLSVASLKALVLKLTTDPSLAEFGEVNIWTSLGDPRTHQEGASLLARHLFQNRLLDHKIIENALPWMTSESEKLRLTGTAFFSEAIRDPMLGERVRLKSILPLLMKRAGDQHLGTRQMAIKGLANVLLVAADKVKQQKRTIVAIFLGTLYDANVVLEGLRALALVFPHLKRQDVGFMFKDISTKTITYLSDVEAEIREASFYLFGILADSPKFRYRTFFAEQARKSLVPLLIHQWDPNPKVSEACRAAFLHSVPFLAKGKLRVHLEELYTTSSLGLPNLRMHICKQLVNSHPAMRRELLKKTKAYFQSRWEEIQIRALELSGVILDCMLLTELDETLRLLLLASLNKLEEAPSHGVQVAASEVTACLLKKWGGDLLKRKVAGRSRSSITQRSAPMWVQPNSIMEVASVQELYE